LQLLLSTLEDHHGIFASNIWRHILSHFVLYQKLCKCYRPLLELREELRKLNIIRNKSKSPIAWKASTLRTY
jgi:hypothetical protein